MFWRNAALGGKLPPTGLGATVRHQPQAVVRGFAMGYCLWPLSAAD